MSATGLSLTAATSAMAGKTGSKMSGGRVIGANDRINLGVIGCGGRGRYDADAFSAFGKKNNNACQIVAACDVYEKRKKMVADK
ncbi:MAG: gfo/Idh/MocA family oxidoreductase, partial [Candidatus Solibacter sp.]|nr:gfo/Idh/MocA family oxidoreductase [Candidatus Solibacter sp.]